MDKTPLLQNRYELLERFLKDETRRIWKARDSLTGQYVVIKGQLNHYGDLRDEFKRLGQLRHPRIARALDWGVSGTDDSIPNFHFSRRPGSKARLSKICAATYLRTSCSM